MEIRVTYSVVYPDRRVLYVDGPGNVAGTFRLWKRGRMDPSEVSTTFSGEFFDFCLDAGARAYVVATHPEKARERDERFEVLHHPMPLRSAGGIRYHLGQVLWAGWLTAKALTKRSRVVIVADGMHYFLLTPLALMGKKVVPMLHCTLWPSGRRPGGRLARVIQRLNGRFFARRATAILCVSPEAERQVRLIAGELRGPVYQVRPQYAADYFDGIAPPPPRDGQAPFRVMFAGRIEIYKGVFDLLEMARRLHIERPGTFVWELCGDGPALAELTAKRDELGLQEVVILRGALDRHAMREAYGRCHALIVPTTASFAEGLNRVACEGAMAGRPVITNTLVPAWEVLGDAASMVEPGDIPGYCAALEKLCDDAAFYAKASAAGFEARKLFIDPSKGYRAALARAAQACGWEVTPEVPAVREAPAPETKSVVSPGEAQGGER